MLALCIEGATLQSVRESKRSPGKFYGSFIFGGGSGSYLLPFEDLQYYRDSLGKTLNLFVSCSIQQIARFNRVVTVFEPMEVLPLKK